MFVGLNETCVLLLLVHSEEGSIYWVTTFILYLHFLLWSSHQPNEVYNNPMLLTEAERLSRLPEDIHPVPWWNWNLSLGPFDLKIQAFSTIVTCLKPIVAIIYILLNVSLSVHLNVSHYKICVTLLTSCPFPSDLCPYLLRLRHTSRHIPSGLGACCFLCPEHSSLRWLHSSSTSFRAGLNQCQRGLPEHLVLSC